MANFDISSFFVGLKTGYGKKPYLSLITPPEDFVGNIGDTGSFSVTAEGREVAYQWYWYDGAKWQKSGMDGNDTPTLSGEINSGRLLYLYRCEITDEDGNKVVTKSVKFVQAESE